MDWLNMIGAILGIVALAFLMGWMEKKKVQSPAAWVAIVTGVLVCLLWMYGKVGYALLMLLLALRELAHTPSWVFYTVGTGIACCAVWYIFNLLGNSIIELALELKETKSRIALMEDSLIRKLDDIASRLPGTE